MSQNYRVEWEPFGPANIFLVQSGGRHEDRYVITLILVIVGGVNWGLVGLLQFDLVATIFGGHDAVLSRIVYILVGISALWQIYPLVTGTEHRSESVPHR